MVEKFHVNKGVIILKLFEIECLAKRFYIRKKKKKSRFSKKKVERMETWVCIFI